MFHLLTVILSNIWIENRWRRTIKNASFYQVNKMPNMQLNTAYWQEKTCNSIQPIDRKKQRNNTFVHSTQIYIQSKIKKKITYTVEPLYKGHPRWWPFKRGGLSWPNFATLVRLSWPFQRGSTVIYFLALLSFKMFADPSFQVKQHLLSTDLLRWFQGSPGDLKSIKWGSTW